MASGHSRRPALGELAHDGKPNGFSFCGLPTSSRTAFSRGSVSRNRAATAFASRASDALVAACRMAAPSRAAVSFDRGMGWTPMPSRCVCRPQPYCSLRCDTTTCGTPACDAVAVVLAPPWWTTAAMGKQLGVIAVGGRDHSLGQRAAGEAADSVQDHAATSSDAERLDDEARGGAGIDRAGRAEPDIDGRVAAVEEGLELARQGSFVWRRQVADLRRRRRSDRSRPRAPAARRTRRRWPSRWRGSVRGGRAARHRHSRPRCRRGTCRWPSRTRGSAAGAVRRRPRSPAGPGSARRVPRGPSVGPARSSGARTSGAEWSEQNFHARSLRCALAPRPPWAN